MIHAGSGQNCRAVHGKRGRGYIHSGEKAGGTVDRRSVWQLQKLTHFSGLDRCKSSTSPLLVCLLAESEERGHPPVLRAVSESTHGSTIHPKDDDGSEPKLLRLSTWPQSL